MNILVPAAIAIPNIATAEKCARILSTSDPPVITPCTRTNVRKTDRPRGNTSPQETVLSKRLLAAHGAPCAPSGHPCRKYAHYQTHYHSIACSESPRIEPYFENMNLIAASTCTWTTIWLVEVFCLLLTNQR